MALAPLYQEQLAAAVEQGIEQGRLAGIEEGLQQGIERGIEQGIEQGIERGIEQGIQRGQRLILENLLQVRFGELDERLPILVEGLSGLSPEQFTLFLLQLSSIENDEAGRQRLPSLALESLLQFCWGDAEEGEERAFLVQAMFALSNEEFTQLLSLLKERSKAEILAQLDQL